MTTFHDKSSNDCKKFFPPNAPLARTGLTLPHLTGKLLTVASTKANFLSATLHRAQQFLLEIPLDVLSGRTAWHRVRKLAVFLWMVGRGFADNRCPMRAAALTYTTLLALVPLLVVALSVSKNLLRETTAEIVPRLLDRAIAMAVPQLELVPLPDDVAGPPAPGQTVLSAKARHEVVERIQAMLDEIDAGKLGAIGGFFLVVVALRLMTTIENTFNDIWGVTRGRSLWRKIVYYWTAITLGPLLLIVTIALTGRLEYLRAYGEWALSAPVTRWLLNLAPFAVAWVAFALLYALMPNTRVRPIAALAGGFVGGTLWQLNSLLSTMYVSRVVTYSKIYGSLGIIPVFLLGVYFAWLIVLFGAQVSYAAQNVHLYIQRCAMAAIDQLQRERLGCRLVAVACHAFLTGQRAPIISDLSRAWNAPPQLLNQLVTKLVRGGLLHEVAGEDTGLQPARPPETITLADALLALRTSQPPTPPANTASAETPVPDDPVERALAELYRQERACAANLNFRDLALRVTDSTRADA